MPGRDRSFGHAEVFAAIGAASFAVARFLPVLSLGYQCPLRAAAGIPCATCGMTRAFVHLAHGEVARALAASPLGALLAAAAWGLALLALLRLLVGWRWPAVPPRLARGAALVGLGALLANWAWLVIAQRA
jgi:hypothetical protein